MRQATPVPPELMPHKLELTDVRAGAEATHLSITYGCHGDKPLKQLEIVLLAGNLVWQRNCELGKFRYRR